MGEHGPTVSSESALSHLFVPGVLRREGPDGRLVPVVLDSPHSGAEYPEDFDCLVPTAMLRRAEDMYVGELFANAPGHGATLIEALFPRSYIDPNRSLDDLDPDLLPDDWPHRVEMGEKARLGHGLIWRFCPPDMLMYRHRLTAEKVRHRIDGYWRPYHQCLAETIDEVHARFGEVWHINCHSMPAASGPGVIRRHGRARADFVLGDRDGSSCDRDFRSLIAETLEAMGYVVAINDPYKGVELVRAYSDPVAARHSLQIEINRALYMNERTLERHSGFDALREDLDRLVAVAAEYAVARLPVAAE